MGSGPDGARNPLIASCQSATLTGDEHDGVQPDGRGGAEAEPAIRRVGAARAADAERTWNGYRLAQMLSLAPAPGRPQELPLPGVPAPAVAGPGIPAPGVAAPAVPAPGVSATSCAGPGCRTRSAGPAVTGPAGAGPDVPVPGSAGPAVPAASRGPSRRIERLAEDVLLAAEGDAVASQAVGASREVELAVPSGRELLGGVAGAFDRRGAEAISPLPCARSRRPGW